MPVVRGVELQDDVYVELACTTSYDSAPFLIKGVNSSAGKLTNIRVGASYGVVMTRHETVAFRKHRKKQFNFCKNSLK